MLFGKKEHYQFIGYSNPTKGSSNFYEQVATIRPVLRLLKEYDLVVIGDARIQKHGFCPLAY